MIQNRLGQVKRSRKYVHARCRPERLYVRVFMVICNKKLKHNIMILKLVTHYMGAWRFSIIVQSMHLSLQCSPKATVLSIIQSCGASLWYTISSLRPGGVSRAHLIVDRIIDAIFPLKLCYSLHTVPSLNLKHFHFIKRISTLNSPYVLQNDCCIAYFIFTFYETTAAQWPFL